MIYLFYWALIVLAWSLIWRFGKMQETIDAVSTHRFADRYQLEYVTELLTALQQEAAIQAWHAGWDEWHRRRKAGEL